MFVEASKLNIVQTCFMLFVTRIVFEIGLKGRGLVSLFYFFPNGDKYFSKYCQGKNLSCSSYWENSLPQICLGEGVWFLPQ